MRRAKTREEPKRRANGGFTDSARSASSSLFEVVSLRADGWPHEISSKGGG